MDEPRRAVDDGGGVYSECNTRRGWYTLAAGITLQPCERRFSITGTYQSRMTSTGQVTAPAELRRELGLEPGDRVEFVRENGTILLPGMKLAEKHLFVRSFDLCLGLNLPLGDAFNLAVMEKHRLTEIYSWDRHFDRTDGVTRIKPGSAGPDGSQPSDHET